MKVLQACVGIEGLWQATIKLVVSLLQSVPPYSLLNIRHVALLLAGCQIGNVQQQHHCQEEQ